VRFKLFWILILISLMTLSTLLACDDDVDDDTVEIGTNVGDKMADFTVTLSDGSSFNLYEHEGTVILFDTAGMY